MNNNSKPKNRVVYVIHGLHSPFNSKRSTDYLAQRMREDGYIVIEIKYNAFDPVSVAETMFKLHSLPEDAFVISHSFGGILSDLSNMKAEHFDVNTIHSDIKSEHDWLPGYSEEYIDTDTHSIDEATYQEIKKRI